MPPRDAPFNTTPLEADQSVRWIQLGTDVFALVAGAATTNANGTLIAGLDVITSALNVISTVHHQVHEGETFVVSVLNLALGAGAAISINLRTGTEKFPHLTWAAACGGDATFELIENHTIAVAGTALAERRMKRSVVTTTDVIATNSPTIGGGSTLFEAVLPGGQGGNAVGNQLRADTEFILERDQNYLLRLTNRTAQAQLASINAQWYEESTR